MAQAGAECVDCHLDSEEEVVRPGKNKCLDCHDEGYENLHTEWQESTKELIQSLKILLLEKQKESLTTEQKAILNQTRLTLNQIEMDGSAGIHNYTFIEETLSSLKKKLESL